MKKIMLIYPPGAMYQRGEERCQLNIDKSSANSMRACNDLGYASSVLKKAGYSIFLKDYQSEKLSLTDLLFDVEKQQPDVIFISTTNATIFSDLEICKQIKKKYKNIVIILKGAIFFDCSEKLLSKIDIISVDYMIGGEAEFIIDKLINYHFCSPEKISEINNIIYKSNNQFIKTMQGKFCEDLDLLPFPDRGEMKNELYVMPDTNEKLATISTSRGCPSSCIYCLSPKISGKKVRFRSAENIIKEIEECYYKFGIKNFFFKSDTFTINNEWTNELCRKIISSSLYRKIHWVANSRTDTVNYELLQLMKKAGCNLIAFGIESGSDESLKKMGKNVTSEQNYQAVQLAKKAGLKTFGFYIIGFPWENETHLNLTKEAMLKNDTDFIELHIATPFYGTELYKILEREGKIQEEVLGEHHFNCLTAINSELSVDYVNNFRRDTVLQYYLRPKYIIKKCFQSIKNPIILFNYMKYGIRLIKNCNYSK